MGLMDLMSVNYKQIFNEIMKSEEAQCLMADFVNHCLLHCQETRDCIIEVLKQDEGFKTVINDCIEDNIKKSKIKSDYFKDK